MHFYTWLSRVGPGQKSNSVPQNRKVTSRLLTDWLAGKTQLLSVSQKHTNCPGPTTFGGENFRWPGPVQETAKRSKFCPFNASYKGIIAFCGGGDGSLLAGAMLRVWHTFRRPEILVRHFVRSGNVKFMVCFRRKWTFLTVSSPRRKGNLTPAEIFC